MMTGTWDSITGQQYYWISYSIPAASSIKKVLQHPGDREPWGPMSCHILWPWKVSYPGDSLPRQVGPNPLGQDVRKRFGIKCFVEVRESIGGRKASGLLFSSLTSERSRNGHFLQGLEEVAATCRAISFSAVKKLFPALE